MNKTFQNPEVFFLSRGGDLIKPFNPYTQGEDPRGKWYPHGTSGGIYRPYLNTWVTQTAARRHESFDLGTLATQFHVGEEVFGPIGAQRETFGHQIFTGK